jgi:hypothetical protein
MKGWLTTLGRAVEGAKKAGHLKSSVNADQFAFEIKSLAIGAHSGFQLSEDEKAMTRVRAIIRERIRSLATPSCPKI